MRVEVCVEPADDELRSLLTWLRRDPDIRRTASVEMCEQPPREGEMGAVSDILQLVTENGWSAANFALTLAAWKQTRPRASRVTVRHEDFVDALTDCSDEEIERITRLLQESRRNGGEGSAG
ncbi:effector-associated constant component EACC1 [Streptomyces niveus]|uniref:effector-associated constant component EACC1 n=1 Tax=Streptomyces niveus TaxID=193462 RepID=UPI00365E5D2C